MKHYGIASALTLLLLTGHTGANAQQDLVYVAVEPCRVADTRESTEGFVMANTVREFKVAGAAVELAAQGGQVNCLNPKAGAGVEPVAVAAYILAVPTESSSGGGVLSAYPADQDPPPVGSGSTVNFRAAPIGNTSIVTVCSSGCPSNGELAVISRNSDEHVVIDVQGYFYPAPPSGVAVASTSYVDVDSNDPVDVVTLSINIPRNGILVISYTAVVGFTGGTQLQCSGDPFGGLVTGVTAADGAVGFLPVSAVGILPVQAGHFEYTVSCFSTGSMNVQQSVLTATLSGTDLGAL